MGPIPKRINIRRHSKLISDSFWLGAGHSVAAVMSFLQALAFGNLLPQQTYGVYRYVLSIAGILSITTLPGIGTAIARATARGFEGITSRAFWLRVRFGLIGSFFAGIGAVYYFTQDNNTLAIAFLIVAIATPLMDSLNVIFSTLQGKQAFSRLSIYSTSIHTFATIISIVAVLLTKDALILLGVYFITWILLRGTLHLYLVPRLNAQEEKGTLTYGTQLSGLTAIGVIATHIDKVLLFTMIGGVELAIYTFATAIPEQIKGLLKNVTTLALPKLAKRDQENKRTPIFTLGLLFAVFIGLGSLLYILVAPYIYTLLFPQYLESIPYSQIFALSLFTTASLLPITQLKAKQNVRALYFIEILSNVLQVIILVVAIIGWGVWGAIIGRVIGRTLWTILAFSVTLFERKK